MRVFLKVMQDADVNVEFPSRDYHTARLNDVGVTSDANTIGILVWVLCT